MNTEDVLRVLRSEKPRLQKQFPLRAMWLFGSVVRGEAGEHSDIDILVDVKPEIGLRMVELGDELEALLGHPVDLVSTRALRGRLLRQIELERQDV